jgi:hypothetical protein
LVVEAVVVTEDQLHMVKRVVRVVVPVAKVVHQSMVVLELRDREIVEVQLQLIIQIMVRVAVVAQVALAVRDHLQQEVTVAQDSQLH